MEKRPHFSLLFITGIFCLIMQGDAAPLKTVNAEDITDLEVLEDDDSTTHTLERLSSAATCLVAGVEYTHGQQIYREDPCEFCLCLDGEMFCWWQDCPPTLEGPCRDRLPFSPCANGPRSSPLPKEARTASPIQETSSTATATSTFADTTTETESSSEPTDTTETSAQSSPTVCVIMGKEYEIGARLPHDTGNCVECICGPGAQVTCSPHQCAPPGDDINDYRPPGPRPPLPDAF